MQQEDGNYGDTHHGGEDITDEEREWEDFGDAMHDLEENCTWWQITRSSSSWVVCVKVRPQPELGLPETGYGKIWYRRKGESLRGMVARAMERSMENEQRGGRPWNPAYPDEGPMTPHPDGA